MQDVTQLRRAERNAEGRLQELEALYAAAPVGLCHVDADLQIVHVNPLFAAVGDRPLDDQIGAKVHDVLPGKISAQLIPQIRGVQAGASLLPILIRARLPDRGSREYAWVAQVHPIASGSEVTGVIIALQDVTVLTERQRQVETMRDHLAEAQHEALVGSWDWNVATDEIWWSPELRELFGVDSSYQASYDAFYEFVHPDDREKARQQLERVLENEIPERAIFRIIRDDGQERTLSTSARLERTEAGQPGRLIGTCQDVTEFDPLRRKRRRKRGRRGAKR